MRRWLTTFPAGHTNSYFLPGWEPTLVDPGVADPQYHTMLLEWIEENACAPTQVIITHAHVDHMGCYGELRRLFGARVRASPSARVWLEAPVGDEERWVEFFHGFLLSMGAPEGVRSHYRKDGFNLDRFQHRAPIDGELREGDTLILGSAEWRVMETPGHAASSVCLFREEDGVLISGDTLMAEAVSAPLVEPEDERWGRRRRSLPEYVHSLGRLAQSGASIVLPGHGLPFSGCTETVNRHLGKIRGWCSATLSALRSGAQTGYEIALKLFSDAPRRMLLTLSIVAGCLDLLEEKGLVYSEQNGTLIRYQVRDENSGTEWLSRLALP